eukprot:469350-Rhodomonas_salina.2
MLRQKEQERKATEGREWKARTLSEEKEEREAMKEREEREERERTERKEKEERKEREEREKATEEREQECQPQRCCCSDRHRQMGARAVDFFWWGEAKSA